MENCSMSVNMTTTEEHVCLQISGADRQLIERAAGLAGQPVEEFVKSEALRSARQILRDDAVIHLTMRGWEQLEALVETEGPPNEALLRAAERNPDVRPLAAARPA
jgi:uncharacterized protein (DUF1778 family)